MEGHGVVEVEIPQMEPIPGSMYFFYCFELMTQSRLYGIIVINILFS